MKKINYNHKNSSGFIPIFLLIFIPFILNPVTTKLVLQNISHDKIQSAPFIQKPNPSPSITKNQTAAETSGNNSNPSISPSTSTGSSPAPTTSNSSTNSDSKTTPSPTTAQSSPTNAPSNSNCTVGFCINTKSVDLTIESGNSAKAFDITAKYDTVVNLSNYPTNYGPGINWSTLSSSIRKGGISSRNIEVNDGIAPGIYTNTINITDNFGGKITLPIKVTVIRSETSRYVTLKSPNGGETYKQGNTVNISWQGNDIDNCTIYFIYSNGSERDIAYDVSTTGNGSYSWSVSTNPTQTQGKIALLCYKTNVGQVKDEGDGFFTVTD